jgi:ABC-type nitrate/sulfonate/bicarbonate transport system ATPase subunit
LNDARRDGECALLEVRIAQKAYRVASGKRLEVLRDVTFSIGRGEVAAFVGPSGTGKTTMLRIIAGLESNYEGRVERPAHSVLGMVFQEPRLLPWRTVDDNVRLAASRASEAQLTALFNLLELTAHRSHYPGELSLGLARRVALARALAVEPDLLILDEPFVSLDDALAIRLRDEVASLIDRRPVTTLLVTHDLDEAVYLADRVFLLSGRPAGIVHECVIRTPRRARGSEDLVALKKSVAEQINAVAETEAAIVRTVVPDEPAG